jgi:adenylate kinase
VGGRESSVIVLLGAPGAGKGTQAPILAERLAVPVLASGDLLRSVARTDSAFGREVASFMEAGELVPDETIVRIFLERLDEPDAERGAILDGFPRTRTQAVALDRALAARGQQVDVALLIHVPPEDLVARMLARLVCSAGGHVYNAISNPPAVPGICDVDGSALLTRSDDTEDTIRARMAQQLPPLESVVEHYRDAGVLETIDGLRPIDDVTTSVLDVVAPLATQG